MMFEEMVGMLMDVMIMLKLALTMNVVIMKIMKTTMMLLVAVMQTHTDDDDHQDGREGNGASDANAYQC